MPENSQQQLYIRAAGGDELAFGQVYNLLAPAIYRHAFFRVSDQKIAEDIMAETFCKVWEYVVSGKTVESLKSFIYRVADNMIVDHYRTGGRLVALDEDIERTLHDGIDRVARADRQLDAEMVRRAMQTLRPEYRQVVAMKLDDLTYEEIADSTGKSKNAAYIAVHRGMKELTRIVQEIQSKVCFSQEKK